MDGCRGGGPRVARPREPDVPRAQVPYGSCPLAVEGSHDSAAAPGQLALGRKDATVRDPRRPAPIRIRDPGFRRIQLPVHQRSEVAVSCRTCQMAMASFLPLGEMLSRPDALILLAD
ncbi:hypothetical protein GCM10010261_59940 [Streptomyces pilosus]|nr:hypothetical protein GCM10010261_59940 [Streptomyces pilosus]